MILRFTSRTIEDISEIGAYLHSRSPSAAQQVRAAVYAGLQTLLLFPRIGRRQSVARVRKLVVRKYGYLVYYAVDAERREIVILAVKHPAQERKYADE